MPVDPWSIAPARPAPQVFSEEIEGVGTLSFEEMDTLNMGLVMDRREELITTYVTGPEGGPPLTLTTPGLNARPVRMSRTLCYTLAKLLVLQRVAEGEKPYTPLQWCGFIEGKGMQARWRQINALLSQATQFREDDDPGNSSAADTGTTSSLPSE